jgi:hypothetical protein
MSSDVRSLADNPATLTEVPISLGPLSTAREACVRSASLAVRRAQVVAAGDQRATC